METRTLLPNLRCLTDRELRILAATADPFAEAAAYVLELRRLVAGLVYRLPVPSCGARRGGLRCDLATAHPAQHFDAVLERHFYADEPFAHLQDDGPIPYTPTTKGKVSR